MRFRNVLRMVVTTFACSLFASETLNSWSAFDDYVEDSYGELSQSRGRFPPFDYYFGLNIGTFSFDAEAMGDVTNAAPAQLTMGVPSWTVWVRETNDVSRVFITEVNGIGLRTNSVPTYDPEAWVRTVYGDPPEWLTADELATWYRERRRERVELVFTLIPSEWYETYRENCHTAATNAVAINDIPVAPADTNRIAFAKASPNTSDPLFSFHLYSPGTLPVDIFGREHLDSGSWSYRGTVDTTYPFTEASVYAPFSSYFLTAARGDIDTDGDGIPDGMERLQFHTNPFLRDSSGDGLSDWTKVYRYGLNPLLRDTDGDGYADDEEIAAGTNPSAQTDGAGTSIRYYYDDDDRLTGGYSGAGGPAATRTLTPAGNPTVLHERSAE